MKNRWLIWYYCFQFDFNILRLYVLFLFVAANCTLFIVCQNISYWFKKVVFIGLMECFHWFKRVYLTMFCLVQKKKPPLNLTEYLREQRRLISIRINLCIVCLLLIFIVFILVYIVFLSLRFDDTKIGWAIAIGN